MRIYKLKYSEIAVLCAIYILERHLQQSDRSTRAVTDYLMSKGVMNNIKSGYTNNGGRIHELHYRYGLIEPRARQVVVGQPRNDYSITKAGWEHIKVFYEKYRSPIEGQPLEIILYLRIT